MVKASFICLFRGYRIEAAWVQGMTAHDPPKRQPATASRTKSFDCLHSIARASRLKAADWGKERGNEIAVALNEPNQ